MKILLIEPNRILAAQYCQYLEALDHQVAWRSDAQAGIVAADAIRPDLVVTELLLAGHSGIEFLYEFRSYVDWLKTPAILLSSAPKSATGVPDKTLADLGVAAFLYKPETSLELLGRTINRVMAARPGRARA